MAEWHSSARNRDFQRQTSMRALGTGESPLTCPGRSLFKSVSREWLTLHWPQKLFLKGLLVPLVVGAIDSRALMCRKLHPTFSPGQAELEQAGKAGFRSTVRPAAWEKGSVMPLERPHFFHLVVEKFEFLTFEETSIWRLFIFTLMKQSQGITFSFIAQESFKLSWKQLFLWQQTDINTGL